MRRKSLCCLLLVGLAKGDDGRSNTIASWTNNKAEEERQISNLMAEDVFTGSVLTCDNTTAPESWMVYCSGRLLQAVMSVRLYDDSKTFLDQPIKRNFTGKEVNAEFDRRFPSISDCKHDEIRQFVDEFFDKEGNELEICHLPDWEPNPATLATIVDDEYQYFATRLHYTWIELCREINVEVRDEPHRFSLLYVPHSFIVPGGRFREFYYWDAYWIVKGLLRSQLFDTAKKMILNFAFMIETYGFVPNGGRVYYLRRSQPPLFAATVYEYYDATSDIEFLHRVLPLVEKELEFWRTKRATLVPVDEETSVEMYQYRADSNTPRPESYREDVISARNMSKEEKRKFFRNVASAAESGWDFSSRWFADKQHLRTIQVTDIVPVDLNAFICYAMRIIAYFHDQLGNTRKQKDWQAQFLQFRSNFRRVFYVESMRGWFDYNLVDKTHNFDFFPTTAIPLFAQCYDPLDTRLVVDVYNGMQQSGAFQFVGGVPTSLNDKSTEQWDFPNSWSPLNHMLVEGLRKSSSPLMQQKAYLLAERWLKSNLETLNKTNAMWEKYNVVSPDQVLASGGEYKVQLGFGWTNGVALDLIMTYGDRLESSTRQREIPSNSSNVVQLQENQKHFTETGGLLKSAWQPQVLVVFVTIIGQISHI